MAGGLRFAGSVGRAYAQSLIAYYGSAFLLDSILPRLASPKSVQVAPQPSVSWVARARGSLRRPLRPLALTDTLACHLRRASACGTPDVP